MRTAELAQALVADLNAHLFSRPFTAVMAYLPLVELGDLDALHVTVVVSTRTLTLVSRRTIQVDHRLEVAVQQRIPSDEPAVINPLVDLVEELAEHLSGRPLGSVPRAEWVQTEHAPLLLTDHLHELRQFTSGLALTYRTWDPV